MTPCIIDRVHFNQLDLMYSYKVSGVISDFMNFSECVIQSASNDDGLYHWCSIYAVNVVRVYIAYDSARAHVSNRVASQHG